MNRLMLVLLAVAVAFSGCFQDAQPNTDSPMPGNNSSEIMFAEPVVLGSWARAPVGVLGAGTNCLDSLDDGDCGLGEPTLEVDGSGTIYVSGVCCLTVSPPVFVSRDQGVSFQLLTTPTGVRETFGIEGDFAVDTSGNVYFSDIEFAATFQVTAWDRDGNFLHHTKWPAPPLVDRDWIRAIGDGHLYYTYNTGSDTNVYESTTGGRTWSPTAIFSTGYGLGNAVSHPDFGFCVVGGNDGGNRIANCLQDGSPVAQKTPMPRGDDAYPVAAFDESGTMWMGEMSGGLPFVVAAMRDGVATMETPLNLLESGTHRLPWLAAGATDAIAMGWYGTVDSPATATSEWFLHVATSSNAGKSWTISKPDPTPVFVGPLARELLDFIQVEIGPDGGVHVAYSRADGTGPDGNEEKLVYIRSAPSNLGMTQYPWG